MLLALPALAAQPDLVITVGGDEGPSGTRAARAVALARAERALRLARQDYAATRFSRCTRELEEAELSLGRVAPDRPVLETLKRLNQWLGLCLHVAGETAEARRTFLRASSLPGPELDPSVFPPSTTALWREAALTREQTRCRLRLPASLHEVALDGSRLAAGARVEPGEHYLWIPEDRRAGRVHLAEDCLLVPPAATSPAPASLSPAEARDVVLLARLGREAGARRLLLVRITGDTLDLATFEVHRNRLVERSQRVIGALPTPHLSPAPAGSPPPPPPSEDPPRRSRWYRKWWVWTAIGLGLTAVVVLPLALTRETRYDLSF